MASWEAVSTTGRVPVPRAHAASTILGNYLIIHGGSAAPNCARRTFSITGSATGTGELPPSSFDPPPSIERDAPSTSGAVSVGGSLQGGGSTLGESAKGGGSSAGPQPRVLLPTSSAGLAAAATAAAGTPAAPPQQAPAGRAGGGGLDSGAEWDEWNSGAQWPLAPVGEGDEAGHPAQPPSPRLRPSPLGASSPRLQPVAASPSPRLQPAAAPSAPPALSPNRFRVVGHVADAVVSLALPVLGSSTHGQQGAAASGVPLRSSVHPPPAKCPGPFRQAPVSTGDFIARVCLSPSLLID